MNIRFKKTGEEVSFDLRGDVFEAQQGVAHHAEFKAHPQPDWWEKLITLTDWEQ